MLVQYLWIIQHSIRFLFNSQNNYCFSFSKQIFEAANYPSAFEAMFFMKELSQFNNCWTNWTNELKCWYFVILEKRNYYRAQYFWNQKSNKNTESIIGTVIQGVHKYLFMGVILLLFKGRIIPNSEVNSPYSTTLFKLLSNRHN